MRTLAALLALGAALLLVACGGDEEATPTPSPSPTAAPAATEAPATAGTASTPLTSATGVPPPQPSASPYERFHYVIDLAVSIEQPGAGADPLVSGVVEGDYVEPDSHSFTNAFEFGGLAFRTDSIIIGVEAWNRSGSGRWTPTTVEALRFDGSIDLTSADPTFFAFDTELLNDLSVLQGEPDTVGGVGTTRYLLDSEFFATVAPFLAGTGDLEDFDELEAEFWTDNETGAVVRARILVTAPAAAVAADFAPLEFAPDASVSVTMTLELSRLNDPTIMIEPPPVG